MNRLITRGFGGLSSSIIVRGFLELGITPEEVIISFPFFNYNSVSVSISSNTIDFLINKRTQEISISKDYIEFGFSSNKIVFSIVKRLIEFLFRSS